MRQLKILSVLLLLPLFFFTQTTEKLEKKKLKVEEKIEELNKISKDLDKKQKHNTTSLNVLRKKIFLRDKSITQTSIEMNITNQEIHKNDLKIEEINILITENEFKIKKLKENYTHIILQLNIINKSNNMLNYIFASSSFSEAIYRTQYIKQIKESHEEKYIEIQNLNKAIKENRSELLNVTIVLQDLKISKKDLLKEMEVKNKKQKQDSRLLVDKISLLKDEKEIISQEIEDQRKYSKNLEDQINKLIALEIEKREKGTSTFFANTPDYKEYSEMFLQNKGKLPWPVVQGAIVEEFGKQKHPVFNDIEINNNGVAIATNPNSVVRSVFKGYIASIIFIPGQGSSVIISHGDYYSVYSNISKVFVRQDQKISTKQEIGIVKQDVSGVYKLGFQIWQKQLKLNPSEWIYKGY